eukprot:4932625-Amphidinium_carterae.1
MPRPREPSKAWDIECSVAGVAPTASGPANTVESFPPPLASDTGKPPGCKSHEKLAHDLYASPGCMPSRWHPPSAKIPEQRGNRRIRNSGSSVSEPKCKELRSAARSGLPSPSALETTDCQSEHSSSYLAEGLLRGSPMNCQRALKHAEIHQVQTAGPHHECTML